MPRFYAGVGSRRTIPYVLSCMTDMARRLAALGFVLRSGHAVGADRAFEEGAPEGQREIFLPRDRPSEAAFEIAASIHPAWHACNDYARCCHARNCYQILGASLNQPVEFVLCWTPDAQDVGGTRTAIVLARRHNIPVYNFADDRHLQLFQSTLDQMEKWDVASKMDGKCR